LGRTGPENGEDGGETKVILHYQSVDMGERKKRGETGTTYGTFRHVRQRGTPVGHEELKPEGQKKPFT